MADEQTLAFLAELERADEAAAAVLAELEELAREVEQVSEEAGALEARLAELPSRRQAAAEAVAEAEQALAERRHEHEAAAGELSEAERAGDRDRIAAARREEVRTRDLAAVAERRREAARAAEAQIDAEERAAAEEREALERRARELATALRARPGLGEGGGTPPTGLEAVAAWAVEAKAALLVGRGALAREREGLLRQAQELGAAVLGEPFPADRPAAVSRRLTEPSS